MMSIANCTSYFWAAPNAIALMYWKIGKRLLTENIIDDRGEYGCNVLASLSHQLEHEFGKRFSYSSLTRMVRFAELFPEESIVVSLIQELT